MPWIDSLDWTVLNSLRKYPIRDGASGVSVDETFSIPDNLFVDFTLSASSDVTRRFYISTIENRLNSIIVQISDDLFNAVGTFEANILTHTEDSDYYLNTASTYAGANGKLTIGSMEGLKTQPAGIFTFELTATELEPRTIIPGLRGVDRIDFNDEQNGRYVLSGDVVLTSRSNLVFSYAGAEVYLDAGDNIGLSKQCALRNCVKSINGVVPDPDSGDISLLGINCINVYSPAQYTLELADTCCQPCSGCNDLEVLTGRLTSLENKFLELKGNYNNVNSQLSTYLSTVNSNCACPA